MAVEYNTRGFIPVEERNYNFNPKPGFITYERCMLLIKIYNDFSTILKMNGKITENDLKNVCSRYDKELRTTQLYTSSLYNPKEDVYYYISSLPFKPPSDSISKIEITCIHCNKKYTPRIDVSGQ